MENVSQQDELRTCKQCGRTLPLSMYTKNGYGYIGICKECNSSNRRAGQLRKNAASSLAEELKKAKNLRLSEFTPRELMCELKRRGYEFTMEYVERHVINSKDLED